MRGQSELYRRKIFQASVTDDTGTTEKIETYEIGVLIIWMEAQKARFQRRLPVRANA